MVLIESPLLTIVGVRVSERMKEWTLRNESQRSQMDESEKIDQRQLVTLLVLLLLLLLPRAAAEREAGWGRRRGRVRWDVHIAFYGRNGLVRPLGQVEIRVLIMKGDIA